MDLHKVYLAVFLLKLALVVVLMVWPKSTMVSDRKM